MPSVQHGERARAWLALVPALPLAWWLWLQLSTLFTRDYTHDDFYLAYVSWLRAVGAQPGRDYHILLYNPLEEFLWPFFRAFPESFVPLQVGKGLIFAVGCGLLYTVYRVARAAGAPVAWSLATLDVVVWQRD